jgi:putative membrane protein insertion efficiency factor
MLRSPALKRITATSTTSGIGRRVGATAASVLRLGVTVALALLRGYKVLVSPLFTGSCRFQPSCSEYMAEAIHRHGLAPGIWKGLKRLSRCRPFGGYGFDPVSRS